MLASIAHAVQRARSQAKDALYRVPAPPVLRSLVDMALRVGRNFALDDGPHMAAGVAYYATFSLFPLVLGVIAVSGFLVSTNEIETKILEFLDAELPGVGGKEIIASNIIALVDARGALSLVAVVFLFWSARAVFGGIHRTLNRAWRVRDKPRFVLYQMGQMFAAAGIGFVFLATIALGSVGQFAADSADAILGFGLPWSLGRLLISTSLFACIYRFVPDADVRWRDAIVGAVFASGMFELAKIAFAYYLSNLSSLDLIYGSVTTMIALMLFFYIGGMILAIGAEISSEYNASSRRGRLVFRGRMRPVRGGLAPPSRPSPPPADQ